ncbi:MAG: hypothetical protein WBB98_15215 [Xanthobacteraceae bacterium]
MPSYRAHRQKDDQTDPSHLMMMPLDYLVYDEVDGCGGNQNLECFDHDKIPKARPLSRDGHSAALPIWVGFNLQSSTHHGRARCRDRDTALLRVAANLQK